jgi:hypothetical protein
MKAFRDEAPREIFLLFLDFFLTKDRDYGTSLIPDITCEHLICFSSMKKMSDHMCEQARKLGNTRIRHVYSVQKIKESIQNDKLKGLLVHILLAP